MRAIGELGGDLEVTVDGEAIEVKRYGETVRLSLTELKEALRFAELYQEYTK